MSDIHRGEIWYIDLDPTIGSEQGKKRPVIVVSNDTNNQYSSIITVIPLTSKIDKIYPFEVLIPDLPQPSKAMCDQIRAVDKKRFLKKLALLSPKYLQAIESKILLHLAIEQ